MTSRPHAAPLADTLWRLGAVMPWLGRGGFAAMAEPSRRHPIVLAMLRSMQQEQRDALRGALTMADAAVRHARDAGQRLMTARDPVEAVLAQAGLALAVGQLAGSPMRAWFDALPKLHDCFMDAVRDVPGAGHVPYPERRLGSEDAQPAAATR